MNSKNTAKQFMNASFDASKSANTINYVNSAYMSAIPTGHHPSNVSSGVPSGAKLSKVGLKQHNSNSRQPTNIHQHHPNQTNNYADGGAMFHG